ncbi:MAG: chromosome condensation regulator [Chthoniobacteraceae bacterium]|nr:chromosome condensation regulator [Chthoniobacteraceae bacterium]
MWLIAIFSVAFALPQSHAILNATQFRKTIAAGARHTLVLRDDGTVWASGSNAEGQLGANPATLASSKNPVQVAGLSQIVSIVAGDYHNLALSSTGQVYSWGRAAEGQLGRAGIAYTPAAVSGLASASGIAAGDMTSFAIRSSDGAVLAWGQNSLNALGLASQAIISTPAQVTIPNLPAAAKVVSVGTHSLVLTTNHTIYEWGSVIPPGGSLQLTAPTLHAAPSDVLDVAATDGQKVYYGAKGFLICSDGVKHWSIGDATNYNNGSVATDPRATIVGGHGDFVNISANDNVYYTSTGWGNVLPVLGLRAIEIASGGQVHEDSSSAGRDRGVLLIRDATGAVYAQGLNDDSQFGDGTSLIRSTPTPVQVIQNAVKVVSGERISAALDSSERMWVWGDGAYFDTYTEWGDGSGITGAPRLLMLPGNIAVKDISVGDNYLLAVGGDGKVYVNGVDYYNAGGITYYCGQLGTGSGGPVYPGLVAISGITTALKVLSTGHSSYCLLGNQTVKSWGDNRSGQLASGNLAGRNIPGNVLSASGTALAGVTEMAGGRNYALFLRTNGTVRPVGSIWESMGNGGAGNYLYANNTVPGLAGVSSIRSGGYAHNLARVSANSSMVIWGNNIYGAFGNGSTTNPNGIFTVPGVTLGTGTFYGAGGKISYWLNNGGLRVWGTNDFGQFGNGNYTNLFTPPAVDTVTGFSSICADADSRMFGIKSSNGTVFAWGDLTNPSSGVWRPRVSQMPIRLVNNPPLAFDTDADGMDDAKEIQYFGNLSQTGSEDPDGDGLSTIQEINVGTNPTLVDTLADNDGINDLGDDQVAFAPEIRSHFAGYQIPGDDQEVPIQLSALDPSRYSVEIAMVQAPQHGTLKETVAPSDYNGFRYFHYTPQANYFGPDSFTVKASSRARLADGSYPLGTYFTPVATVNLTVVNYNVDSNGNGIPDVNETTFYGNDPVAYSDPDGDGYLTADEIAQGSDPNLASSKPFDPAYPPAANLFVASLSWWLENKFHDTLERLNLQDPAQVAVFKSKADLMADGSYDLPFLSIQAAVNAAAPGSVIQVAPGTYAEQVDFSLKDVKLIGQRGARDETIIDLYTPGNSVTRPFGLKFGAGNPFSSWVYGITIRNSGATLTTPIRGGTAIQCENGTAVKLHNILVQNCDYGIVIDNASPALANVIVDGSTASGPTGAGLRVTGNSDVKAANCTFCDNNPGNTAAGQVQASGAAARLTLVNAIVYSVADRAGSQITTDSGAVVSVTYSSIRGGFSGLTNLNSTDASNPQFDTASITGGQRRLLASSPCIDRGNPAGILGISYLTRLDADAETRVKCYGVLRRVSAADIGADEYVSRLKFPTLNRKERGQIKTYSRVDEASDIAYLGTLPNGNAKIAIINDETILDSSNASHNEVTFCEVSATTGEFVSYSLWPINRNGSFGGFEIKDPETVAYDPVAHKLYVTTSMTRVDKFRDAETSVFDPLIDPPSSDYDPRRCVIVTISLDNNLNAVATSYTDALDGEWNATPTASTDRRDMTNFALPANLNPVSPVGHDPANGLAATLRNELQANLALGSSVKSAGVLVAINTVPKFGNPQNLITYQPGQALPYASAGGLGGASTSAGFVLANPLNNLTAAFPYWTVNTLPAAGLQVTAYQTSVNGPLSNLQNGQTYYLKAWAFDAAGNYGRGIEVEVKTSNLPPVRINEFNTNSGSDWVEFFNPSGQSVAIGGYLLRDESASFDTIPAGVTVPARSYFTYTLPNNGVDPIGLGNGSDNVRLYLADGVTLVESYEQYTRNQGAGNTEGRVWDGGPRGKNFDYDHVAPWFESKGAIFRSVNGSPHPVTSGAPNLIQAQAAAKYFQATQNHLTGTGIYLHYANLGEEPAVWRYSPKQQDFHPISVEGFAVKNSSEMLVGLRSPLSNRTSGNAYVFVFSNAGNAFLPGVWNGPALGLQSVKQLNLNGQGIRSIQWCPQLNSGAGAYLIIGGAANGGPLKNETSRQVFSLYQWDSITALPVLRVADLAAFAVRPEGINIISLNNTLRAIFVEDRFKAQGYDTQNAVHWPLGALRLQ